MADITRTEATIALAKAARMALAEFTIHGMPVLRDSEHLDETWSPSGRMMDTALMMALAKALSAYDAALADDAAAERASIVAWLRTLHDYEFFSYTAELSDAIDRGEHVRGEQRQPETDDG